MTRLKANSNETRLKREYANLLGREDARAKTEFGRHSFNFQLFHIPTSDFENFEFANFSVKHDYGAIVTGYGR